MKKQSRQNPSKTVSRRGKSKRAIQATAPEQERPRYEIPVIGLKAPTYAVDEDITPEEVVARIDAYDQDQNDLYYEFAMRTHRQSRGMET